MSDTTRKGVVFLKVSPQEHEALHREAKRRGRTVASLLRILVHNSTEGFTSFSDADRPMVIISPEATEIAV